MKGLGWFGAALREGMPRGFFSGGRGCWECLGFWVGALTWGGVPPWRFWISDRKSLGDAGFPIFSHLGGITFRDLPGQWVFFLLAGASLKI